MLQAAAAAGITVVRSYGMSETAGGCVYDGVPLDGVRVRVSDGRIALGGATLAKGYRNPVDPDPFAEPGWFLTDDLGAVDDDGVLTVFGRADDAISTGGLTVLPQPVEAALCTHPAVADCAVFGLPDDRLGQRAEPGRAARPPEPHPGRHRRAARGTRCRRAAAPGHRQGGPGGVGAPIRRGRRTIGCCSVRMGRRWCRWRSCCRG